MNLPRVRLLERRKDAHQCRLAGAVRPQKAEHALRDRERHVVKGARAVRVSLGEILDAEQHAIYQTTCREKRSSVVDCTIPLGKVERTTLAASRVAPPSIK